MNLKRRFLERELFSLLQRAVIKSGTCCAHYFRLDLGWSRSCGPFITECNLMVFSVFKEKIQCTTNARAVEIIFSLPVQRVTKSFTLIIH